MSTDSHVGTYFPNQKQPFSKKNEEWIEACIDGTISTAYAYALTRRSSERNKLRNYDLFNNKIDQTDFNTVLNPYNLKESQLKNFSLPATLRSYDIISPYFHLLLGEESKRVFQPLVVAVNDDAVNQKQTQKKEEIMKVLEEMLLQTLSDPDTDLEAALGKYKNYTPKMAIESTGTHLLTHYYKRENLDKIFNDCFKDVLLAAEEIVCVDKVGSGPKVRRVNPTEIWYQLSNNEDLIDKADKIYERTYMNVSEIIDEFYEFLTPTQIDELESYGQASNVLSSFNGTQGITTVDSMATFQNLTFQRGIPVHRVRWKSFKKQGIWKFPDETGELQETIVEETFKAPEGTFVEWFWISEYWEGVKIGADLYLHTKSGPRKQQFRSIDNLSTCKSGYVGTLYSATNSQSVSLMDRLVPWIYLYLIILYRTELAIAKNIGKIGLIDLSLIPDTWEIEKWLYYAQSMGFGFVDSFNESNRKKQGGQNQNMTNQNRELDLETGNYIQGHISLLAFIEEQIQSTSGVTKQRLGNISASELVGNTERATVQSSHITEPYFYPHEYFKKRVCETLIEVAKDCMEEGSKAFQYITDDLSNVLFSVNCTEFSNADYGVFVTSSTKEQQNLELYKQLLQSAIQNEKVNLSTVIKTLNSLSTSDIEAKLLEGEEVMQKQQQQMAQQEQEAQAQMQKQMLDWEREKLDREDTNAQLDRENQIQLAEIKSLGADAMSTEGPDTSIITEQAKLALEQSKLEHAKAVERRKLDLEDKKIKAEESRTQMENEHFKKTQKQEKELKNKELIHKERIERIKAKAKPKPKK